MDVETLEQIDALYERYGYTVKKHHRGVRVYVFHSVYNGADIVATEAGADVEQYRREYSDLGYAVKVRENVSLGHLQDLLFHDFFKADGILGHLSARYKDFVSRLLSKLPESAVYEYIQSPYEVKTFSSYLSDFEFKQQEGEEVVPFIAKLLREHKGPLLILIEAAAGYGKTCTAYEILHQVVKSQTDRVPFFTELSRDRRATIFSHILRKEIEEQFANRINSKVTLHEIQSGRIPLIIDGFDELIQKDFSFATTGFEAVESMLSTIVELLQGEAKIVITSRKTAIFNSEEFFDWMDRRNIDYSMVKVTIAEPTINDWLTADKQALLSAAHVPVQEFANPVLLSFLKYTPLGELEEQLQSGASVVDNYFTFLLKREQDRQGLLIEHDTQLRMFKKLARLFTEYGIKTATREELKDLLMDYNVRILEDARKRYRPEARPTAEQLGDTLCNHAFLDRKAERAIGFVNEFVLGTLIGENIVSGKYDEHRPEYHKELDQSMAFLAVQAFRAQPAAKGKALWDAFNKQSFPYDDSINFHLDWWYRQEILHGVRQIALEGLELEDMCFETAKQFQQVVFTNCIFRRCKFSFDAFDQCTMVGCSFFDCRRTDTISTDSEQQLSFYGGTANNNFLLDLHHEAIEQAGENALDEEKEVFHRFYRQGTLKPRTVKLSRLSSELSGLVSQRRLERLIHEWDTEGRLELDGDTARLTKAGTNAYIEKFGKP